MLTGLSVKGLLRNFETGVNCGKLTAYGRSAAMASALGRPGFELMDGLRSPERDPKILRRFRDSAIS